MRIDERGNGTLAKLKAQIDDLVDTPDDATVKFMDEVLAAMFVVTQVSTHVISGSLRASGQKRSSFDGERWEGEITYGGGLSRTPHPGPVHDPVTYAIYEMNRGGEHDFFRQLPEFDKPFEEAINSHFARYT